MHRFLVLFEALLPKLHNKIISDPLLVTGTVHALDPHKRVPKAFNLNTSKLHALGDGARNIVRFRTTDSYNAAIVSLIRIIQVI